MLDSWVSGTVFKHAFTGMAFSLVTAPLTDNCLILKSLKQGPYHLFKGQGQVTYTGNYDTHWNTGHNASNDLNFTW
jgi:hypothetical protein